MKQRGCVAVGMSGGVDSSVAAALLVENGYQVIGLMLHLWNEPGKVDQNRCCTPASMVLARQVCAKLDIPFYVLDGSQSFFTSVVAPFLDGYSTGMTPNPCIICNRSIKWGYMLEHARAFGADYLSTGHYGRIKSLTDGRVELLTGVDEYKDQSYFLSMLTQEQLRQTLLPLGNYLKAEVRDIARRYDLPVAEKKDSQDLCFLGNERYQEFLMRHAPNVVRPGFIINMAGEQVGQHKGLAFFTIGQRKGLNIPSQLPQYVIRKDYARNVLVVGGETDLGSDTLTLAEVNWISGVPPLSEMEIHVKIRYRSPLVIAQLTILDEGKVRVKFMERMRDITPGQFAVVYNKDIVLGGGMIAD
jgi:tRNA-specific 2-thiouridylase